MACWPCGASGARYSDMNRDQLLGRVERAWEDLRALYAGLDGAQLLVPGVAGAWSVRDLLAHVTVWGREALRWLPVIRDGGRAARPPSRGVLPDRCTRDAVRSAPRPVFRASRCAL